MIKKNKHGIARTIFTFILCVTTLCKSSTLFANTQNETQLTELTAQIQQMQHSLSLEESQKAILEKQLENTEIRLGELSRQLNEINISQQNEQKKLGELELKQHEDQVELTQHQLALAAHLRSAYQLSKLNALKILFDQQNPSATNRLLNYYNYLARERIMLINSVKTSTEKLKNTIHAIQLHQQKLQHISQEKQIQIIKQEEEKNKREKLIASFHSTIKTKTSELSTLIANQKTLEAQINHLHIQSKSSLPLHYFLSKRGHLAWPIKGKITSAFGKRLEHSDEVASGITMQAPLGTPIRAIADGTVIFADWLRGFGLLLIINHGDGYMSLYGRNEAMYVKVGESIKSGEIIATIGNTGGFEKTGLYFEIRENGIPINPSLWCHNT